MSSSTVTHEWYMRRCLELARLGEGRTSPNPMVGCVIVHSDRIIGEGFHTSSGAPHAEVEALDSVSEADTGLLPDSTMYVSLEPCCHHGKTPPCTDLIIRSGIRRVVVAVPDPNPKVSGGGIEKLRKQGIVVETGILEDDASWLLRMFSRYIQKGTPYVVIKFAQSDDGFIGSRQHRIRLTNDYSNVLVHRMRAELDAIMIGTNTALVDNPRLTNRLYSDKQPLRVVVDRTGRVPPTHRVFDGKAPTLIFSENIPETQLENTEWVIIPFDDRLLHTVLGELGKRGVMSLLVEGGSELIKSFDDEILWDEARVFTVPARVDRGIRAPVIGGRLRDRRFIGSDLLQIFTSTNVSP